MHKKADAPFLEALSPVEQAKLFGASTATAAAWEEPPEGESPIPDKHFAFATRLKHSSKAIAPLAGPTCLNTPAGLGACGKKLDGEGRHALT
eukprot:4931190-Lingulodinium_polyedra.AAC.1